MDTLLVFILTPLYWVWKIICFVIGSAWKLVHDIAKGVYGKFISWISAIIFFGMLTWIVQLIASK
ncbi:MAG: hypothetical protein JWN18_401 [Parcubacteria group bacterium]|nr:hypothetical protein [Parcubacteria group bacterium]